MDWQPIETAPKDGTRVLVWQRGHLHMIGTYGSFGYYFGPCWWSNGATIEPTHWMPLPGFPKAELNEPELCREARELAALDHDDPKTCRALKHLARELATTLTHVSVERDEHLKLKNELVLKAYPVMDAIDRIRKWIDAQKYENDLITVAQLRELLGPTTPANHYEKSGPSAEFEP